ncbi:MAG: zinc metallopeptidase [Planctomycetes bacterium]|nr:zinc metallopeptidase [Planctomycetota bacterium]
MMFDPMYWVVIGVGMLLSLWASAKTKGAFTHYSQFTTRAGMTGAQVARRILEDNAVFDVKIEHVPGDLTDHYDPRTKTLRLSDSVYASRSMSAFGVAAHEVGHALQHAQGYAPLGFRSMWVPVANFGGGISMMVILGALLAGGAATAAGTTMGWLGLALFGTTTLFTLVTLPVEFDASKRALATLSLGGYATAEELHGAKKVLDAAALTYVAAFVTSLLTLVYWAYALGLMGNRREE